MVIASHEMNTFQSHSDAVNIILNPSTEREFVFWLLSSFFFQIVRNIKTTFRMWPKKTCGTFSGKINKTVQKHTVFQLQQQAIYRAYIFILSISGSQVQQRSRITIHYVYGNTQENERIPHCWLHLNYSVWKAWILGNPALCSKRRRDKTFVINVHISI